MFRKAMISALAALVFVAIGVSDRALGSDTSALHGTVISSADKAPLGGVVVDVYGVPSTQSLATAVTDKNGAFVVVGLPKGTYRVKLSRASYNTIILTGITVANTGSIRLKDPLAMQPAGGVANAAQLSACSNLIQPGQTADVYIVCSDQH